LQGDWSSDMCSADLAHASPPGTAGNPGPHDAWGPGTRVPALTLAPGMHGEFMVDHEQHDTTSILSTIEQRFGLEPLSTRDAAAAPLTSVFAAHRPKGEEADHGHGHGYRRR